MTEKSQVADIDRSIYDIRDAEHDAYRMEAGLTPAIVEKLSKEKNDPAWMEHVNYTIKSAAKQPMPPLMFCAGAA